MNYNKLPFKERKRHLDYQFNQTEKQEKALLLEEMKRLEEEKRRCCEENYATSDKERQHEEILSNLKELEQRSNSNERWAYRVNR